tara:strand:+ start:1068 stop:1850 length:783 start_codon:yes stop_codon:yes gene_type:complete
MGENKGFIKEREIISVLNKKTLKELDANYRTDILKIFQNSLNPNDEFKCYKNEGVGLEKKTDLTLEIKNKKINLSVKNGKSNSVHQESIYSFINFLNSKDILSKKETDLIMEFHWCDGTFDNTGYFENRKRKNYYKKIDNYRYRNYMNTLKRYKDEIFNRALLGTINQPEYLLYFESFNNKTPHFIYMEDLLSYHLNNEDTEDSIGILRLQNCNPCLGGQDHGHKNHICIQGCPKIEPKTKKHRNDVQFKMIDDIKKNFL